MSYFITTTKGVSAPVGFRTQRLLRDADTAWIELTNFRYQLQIFGEAHSINSSLEEAVEELDAGLLHGLPEGLDVTNNMRDVKVADPVRCS